MDTSGPNNKMLDHNNKKKAKSNNDNNSACNLRKLLSLFLLLETICSAQGSVARCSDTFSITRNSKTLKALYCASSNVDLSSSADTDDTITHVVFVVHGEARTT